MSRFYAVLIVLASIAAAATAAATQVVHYNDPRLNGLWVDACTVRFGSIDCSHQGEQEAATQYCMTHASNATAINWSEEQPSGHHETMRWTADIVNGAYSGFFQHCDGCTRHFTWVDCSFPSL